MKEQMVVIIRVLKSIAVMTMLPLLILAQTSSQRKHQSVTVQEGLQLLSILRDGEVRQRDPERFAKAIERLGEIRSLAAIDELARLLTFRRTFEWDNERNGIIDEPHLISITARYPAAGALFRIGKPALPALTRVIAAEETGSVASKNAIHTVIQIFRDGPLEGIEYLTDEAANASSPRAARRLSGAAKKMKSFFRQ